MYYLSKFLFDTSRSACFSHDFLKSPAIFILFGNRILYDICRLLLAQLMNNLYRRM